jgi:hypothetical protein
LWFTGELGNARRWVVGGFFKRFNWRTRDVLRREVYGWNEGSGRTGTEQEGKRGGTKG